MSEEMTAEAANSSDEMKKLKVRRNFSKDEWLDGLYKSEIKRLF